MTPGEIIAFITSNGASIAVLISLISLGLSSFNLWHTKFRPVKVKIDPEKQIQFMQAENISAFSILFTIVASGPGTSWKTIKFKSADVSYPDGKMLIFNGRAHLKEQGRGQVNESRNIPIAIKGGDSKIVTVAFQSNGQWSAGKYSIKIVTLIANKEHHLPKINFELNQKDLNIIGKPNAILTKALG